MVPLSSPPEVDLDGKPVLILSGAMDPIVPTDNAARLASMLERAGASVSHRILPAGHLEYRVAGVSDYVCTDLHRALNPSRTDIQRMNASAGR